MTRQYFYLFLLLGGINFACSILILRGLARIGIKVSFFELRWQIHKHLKVYRQKYLEQTGQTPWPYYSYWATLAGMFVSLILTLSSLNKAA